MPSNILGFKSKNDSIKLSSTHLKISRIMECIYVCVYRVFQHSGYNNFRRDGVVLDDEKSHRMHGWKHILGTVVIIQKITRNKGNA